MAIKLSTKVGGGGGRSPLLPPAIKARGGDATSASAMAFPIQSVGTGRTYARLQGVYTTASTAFQWVDNGVVVFSANITAINTALSISATAWTGGIWYDQIDDLFYFVLAGGATHYLITIDRTGAMALIGSDTTANYGVAPGTASYMERAAHGSGDFTIYSIKNKTTISATTGAATDLGTLVLSGAVNSVIDTVKYVTADGSAAIGQFGIGISGAGSSYQQRYVTFIRKDSAGQLLLDLDWQAVGVGISTSALVNDLGFLNWDGGVLVMQKETVNANHAITGPRFFNRVLFDNWVFAVCDYLGLEG